MPCNPARFSARLLALVLTGAAPALLCAACSGPAPTGADERSGVFTLRHEHIATLTGPARDQPCDIDADLYLPSDATSEHRAPALIDSHGFGATKTQESPMDAELARRGYVVLAYTQLGHEGSGCQIHLDDPDYEGAVASQLVDYLAGAPGLAFADAEHTKPLPALTVVESDEQDHAGGHTAHDPRVGMIGGSYGGEIQFIAAARDPRIDVLVPSVTWNDLNQELAPNFATQSGSAPLPGSPKAGIAESLLRSGEHDPEATFGSVEQGNGCRRIAPVACQALVELGTRGQLSEGERQQLLSRSVKSFIDKINVPVLLAQGEEDRLAPFNEALKTYQALRERHVPVQLLWHKYGHDSPWDHGGPVGDSGWNFDPDKVEHAFASMQVIRWLNHYLKGEQLVDTGASFNYYRPWSDGPGVESALTYGRAANYPAGPEQSWYLTADEQLVGVPGDPAQGQQAVTREPAGGSGPAKTFTSAALEQPVDVVGAGKLAVSMSAGAGTGTVFVALRDIAPDGTSDLVTKLPSLARFSGEGPVVVELAGVAHRFAPGHKIQLTVAGADPAYTSDPNPAPVTLFLGDYSARLTLPTAPAN
ncbi:X-Pro dipeptidyl-peptidase domain protein [Segniliparus rotundus DSM 44985]|uniref:X-Pro dipeptidyl-peptidase domain protein n=1 Tax=Segniliparus rotundus (strain ATCC BAA-972 / CDC 1076 / CIP 108378 / DSM 44985 / JCM 13578) TaxID=640132 RepID=D6Z9F9_SEGRD|nr:CocE/NonD family hydrolase [Segniliparus rotundus]ADG98589.1 X-Pro dipeptidyl-peptidase domain protein [Segniliparus rotundus DSM 44985]